MAFQSTDNTTPIPAIPISTVVFSPSPAKVASGSNPQPAVSPNKNPPLSPNPAEFFESEEHYPHVNTPMLIPFHHYRDWASQHSDPLPDSGYSYGEGSCTSGTNVPATWRLDCHTGNSSRKGGSIPSSHLFEYPPRIYRSWVRPVSTEFVHPHPGLYYFLLQARYSTYCRFLLRHLLSREISGTRFQNAEQTRPQA